MEEWMEALVIERLEEQDYDLDVADVEDCWDQTSIDKLKKRLCKEIDAGIQQALTELEPDEDEDEDDEDDEDDDWLEEEEEERWAARA